MQKKVIEIVIYWSEKNLIPNMKKEETNEMQVIIRKHLQKKKEKDYSSCKNNMLSINNFFISWYSRKENTKRRTKAREKAEKQKKKITVEQKS